MFCLLIKVQSAKFSFVGWPKAAVCAANVISYFRTREKQPAVGALLGGTCKDCIIIMALEYMIFELVRAVELFAAIDGRALELGRIVFPHVSF